MSVTPGPGRTWPIFIVERQLPILAAAVAAPFLHGRTWFTRLSGVAHAPSTASFAHGRGQGDFRGKRGSESLSTSILDRAMVSIPVEIFLNFCEAH
jgi:hypothetical protein